MKPVIRPTTPTTPISASRPTERHTLDIAAQLNVYGEPIEHTLGDLKLEDNEAPGSDPYNNTRPSGIKKFQRQHNSK